MSIRLLTGDCRETLPALPTASVQAVITSPPYYGLRDYGTPPLVWGGIEHEHEWGEPGRAFHSGQLCPCGAWLGSLGLEPTPDAFVEHLVEVFREVKRVLADSGTVWLNLGDSYNNRSVTRKSSYQTGLGFESDDLAKSWRAQSVDGRTRMSLTAGGLKEKDLMMIPFRVAMALQADGWYLRSVIPWLKRNSMPESVQGSYWSRHQVTIEEYERLSGLRYTGERSGSIGTSNMPDLQTRTIPRSEAEVSEESERASYSESTRTAAGCERETPASKSLAARTDQQSEIRSNRKGTNDRREEDPEIQTISAWQDTDARTRRTTEVSTGLGGTEKSGGPALEEISQGSYRTSSDETTQTSREILTSNESIDDGRMATDPRPAQTQMFLLQEEASAVDNGSRSAAQPRRGTPERERSTSLPVLQFEEEQPTDDALVDCPGCNECRLHDGYIFHLSAGRPSTSVEYVFLLAKSSKYFFDADVVRGSGKDWTTGGPGTGIAETQHYGANNGGNGGLSSLAAKYKAGDSAGRNRRNADWFFESWQGLMLDEQDDPLALVVNPAPFTGSHFATFPPKLVEPMVKASTRTGDTVLDCFSGAGTVGLVADRLQRNAILCELKPEYADMGSARITNDAPMFADVDGGQDVPPTGKVTDKQGASGLRRYTGFNARCDAKKK